ncbi:hypothetical protein BDV96DRAFT_572957 [Lophiotrema nucula]|uniref:Uncharacterized protein n=1 Tax=Lophiotrema nucula TaxID=690887 RepID=A0A6A5ZBD9_9PLEO|nr:hypothetical protein BDV96DRAFT_572957 [Lophiotrema nucula]
MGRSTQEELETRNKSLEITRDHDREGRKERKRLKRLEKQRRRDAQLRSSTGMPSPARDTQSNPDPGEVSKLKSSLGGCCETPPPEQTELTVFDHIYQARSEITKEATGVIQEETARVIQFAKKQLKKDRRRLRRRWDRKFQALRDAIVREQEARKRAQTYYKKRVSKDARKLCRYYDKRVGKLQFRIHLERTSRMKAEKKLKMQIKEDTLKSGGRCHNSITDQDHEASSRDADPLWANADGQTKLPGTANEMWKIQEALQNKPPIKTEPSPQVAAALPRGVDHVSSRHGQLAEDVLARLSCLEEKHRLQSQHMHSEALDILRFLVPYFPVCHNPVLLDGNCSACKTWLDSGASAPLLAVAKLANGIWTALSPNCGNTMYEAASGDTSQSPPLEAGKASACHSMALSSSPPSPKELTHNTTATASPLQMASMHTPPLSHDVVPSATTQVTQPKQQKPKKPSKSKSEQCAMLLNQSRRVAKRKREENNA